MTRATSIVSPSRSPRSSSRWPVPTNTSSRPATTTGKNVMPRVAALLDVMQVSDITKVVAPDTFERPIYAGNAIQTVQATDPKKVITVRTAAFQADRQGRRGRADRGGPGRAPIPRCRRSAARSCRNPTDRNWRQRRSSSRAAGRSARPRTSRKYLEPIADKLGAAIGASRAAVDAGYAPNDWQVGQTGKVVAPDLYIAVGISGAIQHLAGMKDSR